MEDKIYVYVVSILENESETIVTVFDNREAAENYLEYAKEKYETVIFDKAPLYKHFYIW